MKRRLQELLSLGEEALGPSCDKLRVVEMLSGFHVDVHELAELLSIRNGFYAFGSALLMRPLANRAAPLGIVEWNATDLWKHEYGDALNGFLCFAEDIFGGQFAIGSDAVVAIDPETGECEEIATSLDQWADAILNDSEYRTGQTLSDDWQMQHGRLSVGSRLLPKMPFVTGGKFLVENLYSIADVEGMRFRGHIARQIQDVPEGGHVVFDTKRRES